MAYFFNTGEKMKIRIMVAIGVLFFLSFFTVIAVAQDDELIEDKTVSLDFQNANLRDVLKALSIQSGLNFIASESVQERKITLYMDKVMIKSALDQLFKANNLTYELDRQSNIFIVKDWGRPQIETVTRVFYLKYATVSSSSLKEEINNSINAGDTGGAESGVGGSNKSSASSTSGKGKWAVDEDTGITKAVKRLLTPSGVIVEDFRTNSLIVTDMPDRMPLIAQVIASLDVPAPEALIEVEVLDVSKNNVDKLGFDFSNNPLTFITKKGWPGNSGDFYFGAITTRGTTGAITLGDTFAQALNFLRTQTDTKFLARPRLLTLNNETAEIKIETSESVGVITTTQGNNMTTAEPERSPTGVLLRVTPQINVGTREITMFIHPRVAEAAQGNILTSGGLSYVFRDPEIRSTKSTVRVKDGETVVIGGLIRNEFSETVKKLPGFGDFPIFGAFFRHKDKTRDRQRELLIFITPHIVSDAPGETPVAAGRIGVIPPREQTPGSSLPNRQSAINSSLNTFERK
jgi:type II secretory pathway component GspD/PulD (secretin)